MGFLDSLASRFGYVKTQQITNAPTWLRAEARHERYSVPSLGLPEAQGELYQRLSWVQIAVTQVANAAAISSFNVEWESKGEKPKAIDNHPFGQLLRRPNPLQSRFELLRDTFGYEALTGNAYWWLNRPSPDAPPDEIWLLPTHKVEPVPDNRMFLKGYVYDAGDGQRVPLEMHEIVHFRRFHPLNSYVGLSPIEALATIASGDLSMQQWNTNFFGENNAKMPGILTVGNIGDSDWETLKSVFTRKHGGTKRELAMLRNTSPGDLGWVGLSIPQSDMEFLAGRQANKEEIFAIYAPGLSSILDVNATEANSTAGKQTFAEFGVWPHMVSIAEKITNDILPAYGDNLVGSFDDIRISDRSMELAEQAEFARYHTIDEVRQEFYGAKPLGDERGKMLPAQIGQSTGMGLDPPPMLPGEGPQLPAPPPVPEPDQPPAPDDGEDDESDEAAKRAERKTLRKWLKRNPAKAASEFTSDVLTVKEIAEIAQDVRGDGAAEDAPFPVAGWTDYP